MHPIGHTFAENLTRWSRAHRSWFVIFGVCLLVAAAATQVEPVPCKCNFHQRPNPATFIAVYSAGWAGLLWVFRFALRWIRTYGQLFALALLFASAGVAWIEPALEFATPPAPQRFNAEDIRFD